MRKTPLLGLMALLVVGLVSVGAFAMPFGKGNTEIRDAIEAGDFEAWKSAITSSLTEERFNKAVEMHQKMVERRAETQEKFSAVQDAIESSDYQAWLEAIGEHPRAEKLAGLITEENFATFAEMYQARQAGDLEKVKELAEELGLPAQKAHDKFHGMGRHKFNHFR